MNKTQECVNATNYSNTFECFDHNVYGFVDTNFGCVKKMLLQSYHELNSYKVIHCVSNFAQNITLTFLNGEKYGGNIIAGFSYGSCS